MNHQTSNAMPSARPLVFLATAVCIALSAGCSSLNLGKDFKLPWQSDKPVTPSKIVAMWTDTILYQPNEIPKRGFGGRLMFYDQKGKDAVKVAGTLVVYAFEEKKARGDGEGDTKPDRKFVFTPEQFAQHYSKTSLGHSYSVWLPWDDVNGEQCEISLIVRFEPEKGAVVVSDQSRQVLPGKPKEEQTAQSAATAAVRARMTSAAGAQPPAQSPDGVRQASYEAPATDAPGMLGNAPTGVGRPLVTTTVAGGAVSGGEATSGLPSRMQTTTITLPPASSRPTIGAAMVGGVAMPTGAVAPAAAAPSAPVQAGASRPALEASHRAPQARYSPSRSRPLAEPIARLTRDRVPTQPAPATSPNHPAPPAPQSASAPAAQ